MSTNWFILLAILVGVVGVLGGWVLVIAYRQKMMRARFDRALRDLSVTLGPGANDPQRLPLHDLRRKFGRGLEIFASHGKDVYTLPWYLMLGKPGVGKTTAIRHSKLSFPPDLNEAGQGIGGTCALDWWFSNEAVFLDTAGGIGWGDEDAGYNELLKLLRHARPRCPINGIFLFVAADELLRDSAEESRTKGSQVSTQVRSVQSVLTLRVPVFVVITKCDLLPGYGAVLAEANIPGQISSYLRWSTSEPDATFRPELIERHLRTGVERLPRDVLGATRASTVDALQSSLAAIAASLRCYLTPIFVVTEQSPQPTVLRGIYFSAAAFSSTAQDDFFVLDMQRAETRVMDENVQFSCYSPKSVQPQKWHPLLVFAHLEERSAAAPTENPHPIKELKRQVEQVLGEQSGDYRESVQSSRFGLPKAAEITFLPLVPGLEFNPERRTFLWLEDVHREEFRLRASEDLSGQSANGTLTVYFGAILLAEIRLSIRVDRAVPAGADAAVTRPNSARPYRKIFASYSHKDQQIVEQFERYASLLGDTYLRDSTHLRAGERWDHRLAQMINEADVFQLFWSSNSIQSEFVEREWRYALALDRPNFIRPTYWEEPLPELPEKGLPPEELRRLHFQRLELDEETIRPRTPPCPEVPLRDILQEEEDRHRHAYRFPVLPSRLRWLVLVTLIALVLGISLLAWWLFVHK